MIDTEHQLIEGAAATALAAGLKAAGHSSGAQAMVVVSSGANISSAALAEAIAFAPAV